MAKNIVLLSDGTGNTSATLFTTNVWRLYEALDLSDPNQQVAYYDDGVGTSGFKPWAIVGGIGFGYGLKRNVLAIYSFLCRNYEAGDRIFGFGFSRGAFTIRVVAGMVAQYGIAPYRDHGSEARLAIEAGRVYRLYHRDFYTKLGIREFVRDLLSSPPHNPKYRTARIHFLGLWDTVAAYGGPFKEVTDAIDYWIWPLSILHEHERLPDWVDRACHALSLDDERHAFWPIPWNEDKEYSPTGPIDEQRLSQVWFAGVHSDVGGGYSQDGLSYVTLKWMMDRVKPRDLLLKPHEEQHLRDCANSFDKLNDSRSGFGAYYRYKPRRLALPDAQDEARADVYAPRRPEPACAAFWEVVRTWLKNLFRGRASANGERTRAVDPPRPTIHESVPPTIHESVFQRIEEGVNAYAPIVLPKDYRVAYEAGRVDRGRAYEAGHVVRGPYPFRRTSAGTSDASEHASAETIPGKPGLNDQDRLWNLVWLRRVVYFATVATSLFFVLFVPVAYHWLKRGPVGWPRCVRWIVARVSSLLALAPRPPEFTLLTGTVENIREPDVFAAVACVVVLLTVRFIIWLRRKSSSLQQDIGDLTRQTWRTQFLASPHVAKRPPWPADSSSVSRLRGSVCYQEFFATLASCVFPTLLVWGPPIALMAWASQTALMAWASQTALVAVLVAGLPTALVAWFDIGPCVGPTALGVIQLIVVAPLVIWAGGCARRAVLPVGILSVALSIVLVWYVSVRPCCWVPALKLFIGLIVVAVLVLVVVVFVLRGVRAVRARRGSTVAK